MQKLDQSKVGGPTGRASTPTAKKGHPFGSTTGSSGGACASHDSPWPISSSPELLCWSDQNNKGVVLAFQSGLKSELTWALNTLTLLSFKEIDDMRKEATPLAKIPGLLDALLQVIDDWHDIGLPKVLTKGPRVRTLGMNSLVTGFGKDFEALGSINNSLPPSGEASREAAVCASSNIIRNLSFMPDNEVIMAQHRHCLETVFQCIEDHVREDEELDTNALETIVNLAPLLDLQIFSSCKPAYIKIIEKRAVQAIMGMLVSQFKAWHCAAAELLGRLIINPDNEPFLLPFVLQIHKLMVDLMSLQAFDAQVATVGALYNLAEVNMDCKLKLASERWAIDRLLKVIKTPHPVPEVCRKVAMIFESLVSETQNRGLLLAYEKAFAEILFSDGRYSDTFARILHELTSRPNNKIASACGIWGCG